MTFSSFLAVRPESLSFDSQTSTAPGKYTRVEMQQWMSTVPEIYALQLRGATDSQFFRMCQSPDPADRLIGETYRQLFSTSPSSRPIQASLGAGGQIEVTAGQHRSLEARSLGVPFVPVHLRASDSALLIDARAAIEADVRTRYSDGAAVVQLHRGHDERHFLEQAREQSRSVQSDSIAVQGLSRADKQGDSRPQTIEPLSLIARQSSESAQAPVRAPEWRPSPERAELVRERGRGRER